MNPDSCFGKATPRLERPHEELLHERTRREIIKMPKLLARVRDITGALVASPFVYDIVQFAAGSTTCYAHLRALLPPVESERVLDAGGGTGRSLAILDPSARYFAADNDAKKLARLRTKYPNAEAIGADVTRLPFPSGAMGLTLLVFVCHHLDDTALGQALAELARVTHGCVLIMDPLWEPRRLRSRLLWHYDEGRHPRTAAELSDRIARHLSIEREDRFTVHHRYHIWRCRPRPTS